MTPTLPQQLAGAVAVVRRRVRARRAMEAGTLFTIVALAAAAIVVASVKTQALSPDDGLRWLLACAALPLLGALLGALRPVTPLHAAQLLDRAHALDSRVASALEFAALPPEERSAFMDAAIADAATRGSSLKPARAMPLRVPEDWPIGLALAVLVLVVTQLEVLGRVPAPPITQRNPLLVHQDDLDAFESALRPMLEDPNTDEALREAARDFNDVLERLADRELDRTEALRELRELETRLAESRPMEAEALNDALRELGNELPRQGLTEAASEAMRNAEAEAAAAAMEQLAERLRTEDISRAELDRLRRAMERAAQDNSERDRQELERRLEERREEMESLLQRQREQQLDEEEESLLRRRQRELETLQRDQQALEERRRQLERLRREMDQAAQDLNRNARDEAAQRMQQMAEDLNRMAREQMSEEQRQEMQRQMEQLREMIRRAREQQGQDGEQGQQGQQGQEGQGQGREGMMQRFRLGASGQGGQQVRIRMPGEGQQGQGQQGQGQGQQGQGQQGQGQGQQGQGQGQQGQGQGQGQQGQGQGQQGQGGQPGGAGQGQGQGQGQGDMELTLNPGGSGGNATLELPGEGQGQGQGQQGQGGGAMGQGAGTESGGEMLGDDPTRLNSRTRDSRVEGQQSEGPSRSEVILGAAERGFVGRGYRAVHTDYSNHAEEVLERDEVPPGYRFYVRRYFQLIRPREAGGTESAGNPQETTP